MYFLPFRLEFVPAKLTVAYSYRIGGTYLYASKNTLPVYTKTILLTMRHSNTSHPTLIPSLAASTYYLKSINKAILADPSYPATATLLKEFPSLSTTT